MNALQKALDEANELKFVNADEWSGVSSSGSMEHERIKHIVDVDSDRCRNIDWRGGHWLLGYQVQANSQRAVEEIRAQTVIQQSILNFTYQTRQLDIEMVKLALNILGGEVGEKSAQSRLFAVKLLQKILRN